MERESRFGCTVAVLLAKCEKGVEREGGWNELLLPAEPAATLAQLSLRAFMWSDGGAACSYRRVWRRCLEATAVEQD